MKLPCLFAALVLLAGLVPIAAAEPASPTLRSVTDLSGKSVDPFGKGDARATLFVFLRTDCPVSNSYAPTIRRLHAKFAPQGVALSLVFLDRDQTPEILKSHITEFDLPGTVLCDYQHALAQRCGIRVTPEAAVFSRDRKLTYAGRIDDRYRALGKPQPEAQLRELEEAVIATLAGKPVSPARGAAVGCPISDLR